MNVLLVLLCAAAAAATSRKDVGVPAQLESGITGMISALNHGNDLVKLRSFDWYRFHEDNPGEAHVFRQEQERIFRAADSALPLFIRLVDHEDSDLRRRATLALGYFPHHSESTIPVLVNLVERSGQAHQRNNAIHALGRLGPTLPFETIELLAEVATNQQEDWIDAYIVLEQLGEKAEFAATAIAKQLEHENNMVRYYAARTLCGIGEFTDDALKVLLTDDVLDENYIGTIIKLLGDDSKKWIPTFVRYLNHPNDDTRSRAVAALKFFGEDAKTQTPALLKLVGQANDSAPRVLSSLSAYSDDHVAGIIRFLVDDNPEVRTCAAYSLGNFGDLGIQAQSLVNALSKCLNHENPSVRRSAIYALGRLGERAGPSVQSLTQMTNDPSSQVRVSVASALGQIGHEELALPALLRLLSDQQPIVQLRAVRALAGIGEESRAIPALNRLVQSDNWAAGAAAAHLAEMKVDEVLPILVSGLSKPMYSDRFIMGFGKFGAGAKSVIPQLLAILNSNDSIAAGNASRALSAMGPHATSAAPKLAKMLLDGSTKDSANILNALRRMNPRPFLETRTLVSLAKSSNRQVSKFAIREMRRRDVDLDIEQLTSLLGEKRLARRVPLVECVSDKMTLGQIARLFSLTYSNLNLDAEIRFSCYLASPGNNDVCQLLRWLPFAKAEPFVDLDLDDRKSLLGIYQVVVKSNDGSDRYAMLVDDAMVQSGTLLRDGDWKSSDKDLLQLWKNTFAMMGRPKLAEQVARSIRNL